MVLIVDQNENTCKSYLCGRSCGRELIDAFSVTTKRYTFGRALVWIGPKFISPYLQKRESLTSSMAYMQQLFGPDTHFSKVPMMNGPVKLLLFT